MCVAVPVHDTPREATIEKSEVFVNPNDAVPEVEFHPEHVFLSSPDQNADEPPTLNWDLMVLFHGRNAPDVTREKLAANTKLFDAMSTGRFASTPYLDEMFAIPSPAGY